MFPGIWIESEYDIIEENIDPVHRWSARIKYRSLRTTGFGSDYARELVLARWGW